MNSATHCLASTSDGGWTWGCLKLKEEMDSTRPAIFRLRTRFIMRMMPTNISTDGVEKGDKINYAYRLVLDGILIFAENSVLML